MKKKEHSVRFEEMIFLGRDRGSFRLVVELDRGGHEALLCLLLMVG